MERRKASCFWSSTDLRNLQPLSMKSWMRLTLKPNARLFWAWSSASKSTKTKSSLCSASIRSRRFVAAKIRTTQAKEEKVCNIVGGVVSPILANLFLHYPLHKWMQQHHEDIPFERYADDAVCHCHSLARAQMLGDQLRDRFAQCGLELHPQKTRVVYCKDADRRGDYPDT